MMKPRDRMIAEIARAEGVMVTLYAFVRDMEIAGLVPDNKKGKLGDVISNTLIGLQKVVDMWDCNSAEDDGDSSE